MRSNRSVPTNTVLPHIVYQDVAAAITWLTNTFGFTEHYRYGDPANPNGAQMYFGNVFLMLVSAKGTDACPEIRQGTAGLCGATLDTGPVLRESLVSVRPERSTPKLLGAGTQSLTIFVEDVAAHFEKTKSANAKIVEDLNETIYGELQYGVLDLDGHHWLFSQHAKDVNPPDWGATLNP